MRERPPGSGRWQLRAFSGNDPLTGKPRQESRTFHGTEHDAGKALAQLVAQVADGRFNQTRATVGQLLDAWLEHGEVTQRPKTLYENRSKIDGRIKPVLGSVRLDKLGADKLDAAYRRWLDEGLSPTTVRKYHSILSAACRQAVRWGWIDRAPTDRATPPAPAKTQMRVPTPAQLDELYTAALAVDPVLGAAVAMAALTGMRRGELVALRWTDVDLVAGLVHVQRGITVVDGESVVGPTKTHATRRIALDELGVSVFRRRWDDARDLSERAGSPLVADPYVLSYNANGARPVGPDTLTHRFSSLCRSVQEGARNRAVGDGRTVGEAETFGFRFHDLRHFSVTTLIAAGVDVRTVAERHGHAQATMTLNRYAHALPERDRAAAGVLGRSLRLGV